MANTKSAIKAARKAKRLNNRNQATRTRLKTLRKKLDAAVKGTDAAASRTAVAEFISAMEKAAKSGVVHGNAVSRAKARTSKFSFAK
jgi:small subunit ribosomal protein S20